eukprot:jgi/Mesvir1/607/Mv02041-RA.1
MHGRDGVQLSAPMDNSQKDIRNLQAAVDSLGQRISDIHQDLVQRLESMDRRLNAVITGMVARTHADRLIESQVVQSLLNMPNAPTQAPAGGSGPATNTATQPSTSGPTTSAPSQALISSLVTAGPTANAPSHPLASTLPPFGDPGAPTAVARAPLARIGPSRGDAQLGPGGVGPGLGAMGAGAFTNFVNAAPVGDVEPLAPGCGLCENRPGYVYKLQYSGRCRTITERSQEYRVGITGGPSISHLEDVHGCKAWRPGKANKAFFWKMNVLYRALRDGYMAEAGEGGAVIVKDSPRGTPEQIWEETTKYWQDYQDRHKKTVSQVCIDIQTFRKELPPP